MAAFLENGHGQPGYEAMKNECRITAQKVADQFREQMEPYQNVDFESEQRPYFLAKSDDDMEMEVNDPLFLGYAAKNWFWAQDVREQLFARGDFKVFLSLCEPHNPFGWALWYDILLPSDFREDGERWLHAPVGDLYY